jgi:cytochrome P450
MYDHLTATCFDQHDPQLRGDQVYAVYDALRGARVARSERHGGFWIVTGYDDVKAIEQDVETFSSAEGVMFPRAPGQFRSLALEQDPPDHAKFRRFHSDLLSRNRIREAVPFIRSATARLVDALLLKGGGDFMQEVAAKLPVEVICHLLGLGPDVARQLREVSEEAWADYGKVQNAAERMIALLLEEAFARRREPREDYLTLLAHAEVDGRPITDDELGNLLQGAALAGHETTMYASGNLVLDLATDAALQERVRADRSLIRELVEESLRLRPPVQNFARKVTRDTEFGGVAMRKGDWVMVVYGAANRDPDRFPCPHRHDIDREFKNHLTFGWGIHRCAGAHLAQTELRLLAETLLDRPPITLDGEAQFTHMRGGGTFMGLAYLPIRFATTERTSA